MATVFKMPMLGQSMEEGTILQWFKQEGDLVRKGDELLEVMSDKANITVEAEEEGILRRILVQADSVVPINTPIAVIGTADEPIDALLSDAGTASSSPATPPAAPAAAEPAPPTAAVRNQPVSQSAGISPRARRMMDEFGLTAADVAGMGTGPNGRVIERDVQAVIERRRTMPLEKPRTTPLAARIAEDLGVNLQDLSMGLPGSRITAEIVRGAASAPAQTPAASADGSPAVASVVPFRGLRKMIADNVTRSRFTAPHVTLTAECDCTELMALLTKLRPEVQSAHGVKLTITDLLIKILAAAAKDHPLGNAALVGDEIRCYSDVNVGVAVAAEAGLIVPVVRNAHRLTVGEISAALKALVERARSGKQTPDDMTGGTITITNLGAFGIDSFDPILVPPQSCILGVCRTVEKPVALNGQCVIRPMMNLCLSFDHRILDGAPAAQFLQRIRQLVESPYGMFV
jgi:pyruvate dehydrogenase E2 component (dihydrolipoamide acetyltransferase)